MDSKTSCELELVACTSTIEQVISSMQYFAIATIVALNAVNSVIMEKPLEEVITSFQTGLV